MNRIIFHIDVNSAYLSWEATYRLQQGEHIDLRTIPSVVGGSEASRHGIVLAKSLPAKTYNIHTGESLFAARQKCPHLKIVPPRYALYMQCSKALINLLKSFSDTIQVFSIDECFLDFTFMTSRLGPPVKVADQLRIRIEKELGFTVNIGISESKLLAKMAGELKKPNQTITLFANEIASKLWPLPVEELYMVGRSTAPKLKEMGIKTIGDLAKTDLSLLQYRFKSFGKILWQYANGIEDSHVQPQGPAIKGMGNSTTIAFDVTDRKTAHLILLSLAETLGARLRAGTWCAGLVAVSIKSAEFHKVSKQRLLCFPTNCTSLIFESVKLLFDEAWEGQPIRHLGIRTSHLTSTNGLQLSFFEEESCKHRALDQTIDTLRQRYGNKALIRSSFLQTGLKPITGGVVEEEYQMMSSQL